jgi:hypothetical protein
MAIIGKVEDPLNGFGKSRFFELESNLSWKSMECADVPRFAGEPENRRI